MKAGIKLSILLFTLVSIGLAENGKASGKVKYIEHLSDHIRVYFSDYVQISGDEADQGNGLVNQQVYHYVKIDPNVPNVSNQLLSILMTAMTTDKSCYFRFGDTGNYLENLSLIN